MTAKKRLTRVLGPAVAAWVAVAFGVVSPGQSTPERPMSNPAVSRSTPRFLPLPGKAVGVLVGDAQALLAQEGRFGPADAVCFSRGGGSYRWMYVLAKGGTGGESLMFGGQTFDHLVLANPQTLRPWGVTAPYSLVEVVVNGGRGSGEPEDSFAATDLKVLDGSQTYPLKVAEVIRDLRRRYAASLRQQKGIAAELNKIQKSALGNRKPTGPREQTDTIYVTWLTEAERLRVEFRTQIRDGAYQYGRGIEPTRDDSPRADGPPPPEESPRDPGQRYGTSIGIITGMVYEVSKAGQLELSQPISLRPFVEELPPPGMAPPGALPPGVAPPVATPPAP
jgi:hypothetical protein